MDIKLIIEIIVGLIVLLAFLIVLFILPARSKEQRKQKNSLKKNNENQNNQEEILPFDDLRAIIRSKSSSKADLEKAVDQIVKHYSKIHPKMGIRSHPDFDKYVEIIVHLVRHKNTDKKLILKLDQALTKQNPEYKAELNDALTKALNSLGS
jgi:lipopolysaccharide export LptBFGC system permease protein LptF